MQITEDEIKFLDNEGESRATLSPHFQYSNFQPLHFHVFERLKGVATIGPEVVAQELKEWFLTGFCRWVLTSGKELTLTSIRESITNPSNDIIMSVLISILLSTSIDCILNPASHSKSLMEETLVSDYFEKHLLDQNAYIFVSKIVKYETLENRHVPATGFLYQKCKFTLNHGEAHDNISMQMHESTSPSWSLKEQTLLGDITKGTLPLITLDTLLDVLSGDIVTIHLPNFLKSTMHRLNHKSDVMFIFKDTNNEILVAKERKDSHIAFVLDFGDLLKEHIPNSTDVTYEDAIKKSYSVA